MKGCPGLSTPVWMMRSKGHPEGVTCERGKTNARSDWVMKFSHVISSAAQGWFCPRFRWIISHHRVSVMCTWSRIIACLSWILSSVAFLFLSRWRLWKSVYPPFLWAFLSSSFMSESGAAASVANYNIQNSLSLVFSQHQFIFASFQIGQNCWKFWCDRILYHIRWICSH